MVNREEWSSSEIAGCRLYMKPIERSLMLASLNKRSEPQPKIKRFFTERPSSEPLNVNAYKGKRSASEIAGCRLHFEAMERKKWLELLVKERCMYRIELSTKTQLWKASTAKLGFKKLHSSAPIRSTPRFGIGANNKAHISMAKSNIAVSEAY